MDSHAKKPAPSAIKPYTWKIKLMEKIQSYTMMVFAVIVVGDGYCNIFYVDTTH